MEIPRFAVIVNDRNFAVFAIDARFRPRLAPFVKFVIGAGNRLIGIIGGRTYMNFFTLAELIVILDGIFAVLVFTAF